MTEHREWLKKELTAEIDSMLEDIISACTQIRKHPDVALGGTLQNTWQLYMKLGKLHMLSELDFVEGKGVYNE